MNAPPVSPDPLAAARELLRGAHKWTYLQTSARGLLLLAARDAMLRYFDAHMNDGGDKAWMFERSFPQRAG